MFIKFSNDLITGNEMIDNQHREWFKRLDDFWHAAKQNRSKDEVIKTLVFLIEYVETHFANEERLQLEVNYPGYAHQKEQHDWYRSEIGKLVDDLQKQGASFPVTVDTLNSMFEWAAHHIKFMDRDMVKYIQAAQKPAEEKEKIK